MALPSASQRRSNSMNIPFMKLAAAVAVSLLALNANAEARFPVDMPKPKEGQLVHIPPTMEDLEKSDFHPELKRVIRRGYDLFMNTQQLRGKNVFNNMNCSSCHMGRSEEHTSELQSSP